MFTELLPQASEKEREVQRGGVRWEYTEATVAMAMAICRATLAPGLSPWTPAHSHQTFWGNTASDLNDLGQLYGLRSRKGAHQPPGHIWDSGVTKLSLTRVLGPMAARYP